MWFFLLGTLDLSDVALAGNKRHRKRIRARVKVKKCDYVLVKQLGGCDKETLADINIVSQNFILSGRRRCWRVRHR